MRPLQLTMTAFGPYKHKEVVNFRDLQNHRLFVISGNTGAGKTTIFDAICFALYGDASGEDRNDVRMLRSDFSDDELHTSVELIFELKGRVYKVFRQLAHTKEGNKSATGDRYEFFEITDEKEIPLTDRFIVSQVNERIQSIIGLTKDQFSQIVMLPQGEFRKLLTSETENKEEILRRIFKTGFYKNVGEHLNQRRRDSQKLLEEQLNTRDIYIESVKANLPYRAESELFTVFSQEHYNTYQVLNGLENEIAFYEELNHQKSKELKVMSQKAQEYSAEYHKAEAINERFNQLEQKRSNKKLLEEQSGEMKKKELKLQLADKASYLEPIENYFLQIKKDYHIKQQDLHAAEAALSKAILSRQNAETIYKLEVDKESLREKTTIDLLVIQEYLPTVIELEGKSQQIDALKSKVQLLMEKVSKLEVDLQSKQTQKNALLQQTVPLEESLRFLVVRTEEIAILRNKVQQLKYYLKIERQQYVDRQKAEQDEKTFLTIEKQFELLEKRWLEGQASYLASHLHDGQSCPVCGSSEHPRKAIASDEIPTKEDLDEKRKEKRQAEQVYHLSKANSVSSLEKLKELNLELINNGLDPKHADEDFNQIVEQGLALDKEIKQLKQNQITLDELKKNVELVEDQIQTITKEHNELNNLLASTKADFQTEQSLFEQSIVKIPQELRNLTVLQTEIEKLTSKKQQLEKEWKQAQTNLQIANEHAATSRANVESEKKQLTELNEKYENVQIEFATSIKNSGFESEVEYQLSKMKIDIRTDLKREIELYNEKYKTVTLQISELELELNNKERVNLNELKENLAQLELQVEHLRESYQQTKNYLERAIDGREKINVTNQKLQEVEQTAQLIKDLYDVVRGENTKKISFERYLQIEFLEQIIQAANLRLKQLSNGQYVLVRSDRLEKRGKQSGLGLDVLDQYTGQLRDVKTLSGGEKFNASLCLALGMADVIQAYEGGISIETMFIDEGFGSLDEESLTKAIDTLIDLQQSGRMIGVISHVAELKQAIPAILEVKKTKEGYSHTKFVIS
jgi:DNA repair protein SbcC/Rad50